MDAVKTEEGVQINNPSVRTKWIDTALNAYKTSASEGIYASPERKRVGEFIGNVIANEVKDIPFGEKPIVLSVASNVGVMEAGIQEAIGSKAKVISGDLGQYPREPGTTPLQADAAELPFAKNSIPVIVDILGGSWHDLLLDKASAGKTHYASELFGGYRSRLKDNGILVLDNWSEGKSSTQELIAEVYGKNEIPGFEPPQNYTDGKYNVSVYRKLGEDK